MKPRSNDRVDLTPEIAKRTVGLTERLPSKNAELVKNIKQDAEQICRPFSSILKNLFSLEKEYKKNGYVIFKAGEIDINDEAFISRLVKVLSGNYNIEQYKYFNVEKVPGRKIPGLSDIIFHLHKDYISHSVLTGLLHCLEQSSKGGESILFDINSEMKSFTEDEVTLMKKTQIDFGNPNSQFPLIDVNGNLNIGFNRLEKGPSTIRFPKDFSRKIIDKIELIESKFHNYKMFKLQPGETIIYDNSRMLHGKLPFKGDKRHLINILYK